MGIVGGHPESGVRVDLQRPREGGPPWRYEGEAATPSARLQVAATVEADGRVAVQMATDAPEGLSEKVRLIVRAAWKHTHEHGQQQQAPPRRIARWRSDL
ncbi:MAG TPA: hypothetical protein VIF15_15265 [Polyangiaceae bacterium]|jgi:hypothetical protein